MQEARVRERKLTLLYQICEGDGDAFTRCVQLFGPRLHSVAYKILTNTQDAQDVVQESFLILFQRGSVLKNRIDNIRKLSSWLVRVTVNLSLDRVRRRKRNPQGPQDGDLLSSLPDPYPLPDEVAERRELRRIIVSSTRALTQRQREVFALCDLDGIPASCAAEILSCNVSEIRSSLYSARRQLSRVIKRNYPEGI